MTRHEVRAIACAALAFAPAAGVVACSSPDSASRAQALSSPAARRLIGAWRVSFWLDRAGTIALRDTSTSPVHGTMVFVEDSQGPVSTDALTGPTHDGAYDIDFSRFGFTTRSAGEFPGAVAQVADVSANQDTSKLRDSLQIILSPGTQSFAVRMTGEMRGDSIVGTWRASAYRADAGSGHFIMRRQTR